MNRYFEEKQVPQKLAQLNPAQIKHNQELIQRGPGTKLARKMMRKIFQHWLTLSKQHLFMIHDTGVVDQLLKLMESNMQQCCASIKFQDKYRIGCLTESQIKDSDQHVRISGNIKIGLDAIKGALSQADVGKLPSTEAWVSADLMNFDQSTLNQAQEELDAVPREYNQLLERNKKERIPNLQSLVDGFEVRIGTASTVLQKSKYALVLRDPKFNSNYQDLLMSHAREALQLKPFVGLTKEEFILKMGGLDEEVRRHICELLYTPTLDKIKKMSSNAKRFEKISQIVLPYASSDATCQLLKHYNPYTNLLSSS